MLGTVCISVSAFHMDALQSECGQDVCGLVQSGLTALQNVNPHPNTPKIQKHAVIHAAGAARQPARLVRSTARRSSSLHMKKKKRRLHP